VNVVGLENAANVRLVRGAAFQALNRCRFVAERFQKRIRERFRVEQLLGEKGDGGLPLSSGPPDLLARRFLGSGVHAATSP